MFEHTPLGKKIPYVEGYDASRLQRVARALSRQSLGMAGGWPFDGLDYWTLYELGWLNRKGKPVISTATIAFSAKNPYLVESKSFKLYLNGFNQTRFASVDGVRETMLTDLKTMTEGEVNVTINPHELQHIAALKGECIDDTDITVNVYQYAPDLLQQATTQHVVTECLYSHLLRSNCPVTGQPDWATLVVDYTGPKINRQKLLRYIVSFRLHHDFHEACVERIFTDIKAYCFSEKLTVVARYTRRGGIDINPVRTDHGKMIEYGCLRLLRQ